jgi:hypothetical protein
MALAPCCSSHKGKMNCWLYIIHSYRRFICDAISSEVALLPRIAVDWQYKRRRSIGYSLCALSIWLAIPLCFL